MSRVDILLLSAKYAISGIFPIVHSLTLWQVRQGNWADATEMLGEANPFRVLEPNGPTIPDIDGGIKVVLDRLLSFGPSKAHCQIEASMCHLRGLLMLKLNRGDQAKHCFMEALALDVKCYDAFEQLVSGEMMTPEEGLRVLSGPNLI